ncbi:cytochrome P450 [Paraliomyxa miuraensis]|uniref:cytochrome P450 n=1 Tax=Paraliomyxa miuraensis TaxID=376150 RepID=UPI002256A755|nr:cytochrome P450 [Paraliomyxa miuraensis]MCX4241154.1 cytochrome P450 [Paraliomyxa miuraensis]
MTQPQPVSTIPGLRPLPLVGDRLALVRLFRNPLEVLLGLHREHGSIAALSHEPLLVCAFGPELNQQILPHAREFEHFTELPVRIPPGSAAERMNGNLTVMTGERHQAHRRLMMPAFQRMAVRAHRDDMVQIVEQHIARWSVGTTVDLANELQELTLTVMLRCLFGVRLGDDPHDVLRLLGKELLGMFTSPATILLPLDLPFTPYGKFMRVCERIVTRMHELVEQAREREGHDVLSTLVRTHDEDGTRLTDTELVGHMILLVIAGHETSANALLWTLLLLPQHPRIHQELCEELDGALHGDAPTVEQLTRLPLLDAVVKESMRLMPPTYMMFMRRANGDFELGPYPMPTGTTLLLSALVTHRMPSVWPDPERFDPERWQSRRPTPFEYLPFGAGPRLCLGATFAEQEVRVLLAVMLQRVRLRPVDGLRVDPKGRGITMGPKDAVPVRVEARDRVAGPVVRIGGSIRRFVRLGS